MAVRFRCFADQVPTILRTPFRGSNARLIEYPHSGPRSGLREHSTMNSKRRDHGGLVESSFFRIIVFLSQSSGSHAAVRVVQKDTSVFFLSFHSNVIRCAFQRSGCAGTLGAGGWRLCRVQSKSGLFHGAIRRNKQETKGNGHVERGS